MERVLDAGPSRVRPNESWSWDSPGAAPDGDLLEVPPEDLRPYAARWQRPRAQLAARVALWAAVVLGCVSGLVALARPTAGPAAAPTADAAGDLPGPVAGTAERAVAAWLVAGDDDPAAALGGLFVEPVRGSRHTTPIEIGEVTTVAGSAVGPGYWWVTVAVDVTETPSDVTAAGAGDEDASPADPVTTTWYVQVAVVGDVESRLAVLTTPQVVPVSPAVPGDWQRVDGSPIDAGTGPYDTVEGFLRALLLGDGDPARYMTPGWSIELPPEPMFVALEITGMSGVAPADDGPLRVRVEATVDTAGGNRRPVAYTVEAIERDGRWEVVDLPGGPTVRHRDGGGVATATTSSLPPPTTGGAGDNGDAGAGDAGDATDVAPSPEEWVPDGATPPPDAATPPPDSGSPSSGTPDAPSG